MANRGQGRSGGMFFAVILLLVAMAIVATALAANDFRNMNRLLAHFDLPPISLGQAKEVPRSHETRGNRIPRPRVEIPERLVSRLVPTTGRFVRIVRKDPQQLCEALRRSGFASSDWKQGLLSGDSWECTSYREFLDDRDGEGPPSSAFLSIRGNRESHITSFRIKLNLQEPATRDQLTTAAIGALEIFLDEANWAEAPEIFADIRALKEFDIVRFGNRIQLRREFGETPRYNFFITPDRSQQRNSFLPDYFDREQWLPMPEPTSEPT